MYQLNPRLASEIFDGEYIIANLDTGLYYSVQGIAVSLIKALPAQEPFLIMKKIAQAFGEQSELVEQDLKHTFQQLIDEEIILQNPSDLQPEGEDLTWPEQYVPSKFNRYADMQDLLLLDPIHDVDEAGWAVKNNE